MGLSKSEKKMADCDYFHADLKVCKRGLYGSNLTLKDCLSCKYYSGPPRGLGDKLTHVFKKVGIEKLVDVLTPHKEESPEGCGCGKRRRYLNEKFPTEQSND